MIIRNKKTGLEYKLEPDEWEAMKKTGDSSRFVVISTGESVLKNTTPIPLKEVQEYYDSVKGKRKQQQKNNN